MANEPQPEMQDTTHTYVARAWYRDSQTWILIGGTLLLFLQDADFQQLVPERYHTLLAKVTLIVALVLRKTSATRPIAMTQGETREVRSIPPKTGR